MKYVLLVLLALSFRFPALAGQIDKSLMLPKRNDIMRVTITSDSRMNWFTAESLWAILPKLIPVEGSYLTKTPFQKGTLELKNGTSLTWMAFSRTDVMLYSSKGEQLYRSRDANERELFPMIVDGKLGYIDVTGKVVIEPKFHVNDVNGYFHDESYFKGGLAIVSEENNGGFIDQSGTWVLHGSYYPRGSFSDGLARVSDSKNYDPYKIGFMNREGKFEIPPLYDRAEDFSEDLACVQFQGKYGYIDRTGRMVIPARFDEADSFDDGLALVNISGVRRGYIDKTGKFMKMPDEVEAFYRLAEGLIAVKSQAKWGFINTQGQIVIAPQFEFEMSEYHEDVYYGEFSNGIATAKLNGKWGYINKDRKFLIQPQFDKVKPFEGDVAAVRVEGKWGLIDKTGKFLAAPQFERIENFAEGVAVISIDGKEFGYIDLHGHIVIQPKFTGAISFSEGLAAVQIGIDGGLRNSLADLRKAV